MTNKLPKEIKEAIKKYRLEMRDTSYPDEKYRKVLLKHLGPYLSVPKQEDTTPIDISKAHKVKSKGGRFYGNCPSCKERICISMELDKGLTQ